MKRSRNSTCSRMSKREVSARMRDARSPSKAKSSRRNRLPDLGCSTPIRSRSLTSLNALGPPGLQKSPCPLPGNLAEEYGRN